MQSAADDPDTTKRPQDMTVGEWQIWVAEQFKSIRVDYNNRLKGIEDHLARLNGSIAEQRTDIEANKDAHSKLRRWAEVRWGQAIALVTSGMAIGSLVMAGMGVVLRLLGL